MFPISEITSSKNEVCDNILRKLPKWFGIESAIVDYSNDVKVMHMLVAKNSENQIVGFLSLNPHNDFNFEIHVMGVLLEFHGKGIGTSLTRAAEQKAKSLGAKFLTVKTLSPSRPNPEYDLTRKFYYSAGFIPLEEFKTLWGEANPCLLMIKVL